MMVRKKSQALKIAKTLLTKKASQGERVIVEYDYCQYCYIIHVLEEWESAGFICGNIVFSETKS